MAEIPDFEISLRQGTASRNYECEGCGRTTARVLDISGADRLILSVVVCDGCQDQLRVRGHDIETEHDGKAAALVAAGMSTRLAHQVARRWK